MHVRQLVHHRNWEFCIFMFLLQHEDHSKTCARTMSKQKIASADTSLVEQYVLGVVSGASATTVTHAIDSIKVRLQADTSAMGVRPTVLQVIRNAGVRGLYQGLGTAYLRHATYSGIRMILYNKLRYNSVYPVDSFSSGMLAGCISAFITAPVDQTLIRKQLKVKDDRKFFELWRGSSPSIVRAGLVTTGQLSAYETIRNIVRPYHLFGTGTSSEAAEVMFSGVLAGVVAVTLAQPCDFLKTRLMSTKQTIYNGVWDCVQQTLKKEGVRAFYKGGLAGATRQVPQTLIFTSTLELYAKWLADAKTSFGYSKKA
jgi:hypothetical protein